MDSIVKVNVYVTHVEAHFGVCRTGKAGWC